MTVPFSLLTVLLLVFNANAADGATDDACVARLQNENTPSFSEETAKSFCKENSSNAAINCAGNLRADGSRARPTTSLAEVEKAVAGLCASSCPQKGFCSPIENCFRDILSAPIEASQAALICAAAAPQSASNCYRNLKVYQPTPLLSKISNSAAVMVCTLNPTDSAQSCLTSLTVAGVDSDAVGGLCAKSCASRDHQGLCSKAQACVFNLTGISVQKTRVVASSDKSKPSIVIPLNEAERVGRTVSDANAADLCGHDASDIAQSCVKQLRQNKFLAEPPIISLCSANPSIKARTCLLNGVLAGFVAEEVANECVERPDSYSSTTSKAVTKPNKTAEMPTADNGADPTQNDSIDNKTVAPTPSDEGDDDVPVAKWVPNAR